MNRPSPLKYVIGNPLGLVVAFLATADILYKCAITGMSWFMGLGAILWAASALGASQAIRDYNDWKMRWQSYDRAKRTFAPSPVARFALAVSMLGGVAYYLSLHADIPGYALALAWMEIGVAAAAAIFLMTRLPRLFAGRRRRPATKQFVARQCLRAPKVRVSLRDAYAALPPHCHAVLLGR